MKLGVISVDGHVKASRAAYRDYVEGRYLDAFDDWVKSLEGQPDAGNKSQKLPDESQWDSDLRWSDLEPQGVVAEVLFPNGLPFTFRRFEDAASAEQAELTREGQRAYNRWLADFCALAPGRRAGNAVVSFDDIDAAVADIHWAAEHGLKGMRMPPLTADGPFFFDPVLDPVWAACEETGITVAQHGGTGSPAYPPGMASILTLPIEQSFFSGRSMWQMINGGVFERFPALKYALVETMVDWIPGTLRFMDGLAGRNSDWMRFGRSIGREAVTMSKLPSECFASNVWAGSSPPARIEFEMRYDLGVDRMMFGVDYPHFETAWPAVKETIQGTLGYTGCTEEEARMILLENPAAAFGFDLDALAPHVDRVGVDSSELLDWSRVDESTHAEVSYMRQGHAPMRTTSLV